MRSPGANDRTLAIIAGASVAVSVAELLARLAGVLPDGPSALSVIVAAAIGLKVAPFRPPAGRCSTRIV
jgi:hypothetical protein